ncbi:preprotein translocase subunit SecE [Kineosphaera limosa]|uniref:Protein translocase subunit SecE n=1 Tax=Kineosphaera limosa NBRC 100340 TaxID=1184609 RepID=K6X5U8_9MICO|nr:preprotein translocase subunit SecE [Kineosphaera limosa]NYE02319.1 preprotein translocase subunit SecE [Kineosphaera limosa]GAB94174.1 preprotein translocase SecE subunit [Kineosphaera limosa NBRC 100340]
MSDQRTAAPGARSAREPEPRQGNVITRFFASIGLFLSQVIDEIRKVVRPTREELRSYTIVVIVFVTVVMMFVFGLDTVFTRLVFWVFAG